MAKQHGSYSVTLSLFILMAVVGTVCFFHSPFFLVQDIRARGSSYSTERLADVAGIEKGTSLLRLNVELAQKYLEEEPIICRAVVRRHLPDVVFIDVEEHTPIGLVPHGPEFWGVAADGTVLGRVDLTGVNLPIITGADTELLVIGRKDLTPLVMATSILQLLTPTMRDCISEVNVETRDGLRLVSRDLVEFHLGGPGRMESKLQVASAFLSGIRQAAPQPGMLVDISNPNRPVVRR